MREDYPQPNEIDESLRNYREALAAKDRAAAENWILRTEIEKVISEIFSALIVLYHEKGFKQTISSLLDDYSVRSFDSWASVYQFRSLIQTARQGNPEALEDLIKLLAILPVDSQNFETVASTIAYLAFNPRLKSRVDHVINSHPVDEKNEKRYLRVKQGIESIAIHNAIESGMQGNNQAINDLISLFNARAFYGKNYRSGRRSRNDNDEEEVNIILDHKERGLNEETYIHNEIAIGLARATLSPKVTGDAKNKIKRLENRLIEYYTNQLLLDRMLLGVQNSDEQAIDDLAGYLKAPLYPLFMDDRFAEAICQTLFSPTTLPQVRQKLMKLKHTIVYRYVWFEYTLIEQDDDPPPFDSDGEPIKTTGPDKEEYSEHRHEVPFTLLEYIRFFEVDKISSVKESL